MTVLVTGANGFVASRLIPRLLADGADVVAATGPEAGQSPWLEGCGAVVPLNLEDEESVGQLAGGRFEAVIHLAGVSSGAASVREVATTWSVNVVGTVRLAEAVARESAQTRLLFASTGLVYGNGTAPSVETDPVSPRGPYATSKAAAELALAEVRMRTGLQVMIARSFVHSGPGQDTRFVLPAFAERIREAARMGGQAVGVGNLEPVRDILHVEDVVDAYVRLLNTGEPGETYNVASGEGTSIGDLFHLVAECLGTRMIPEVDSIHVRPSDTMYSVGDSTKLKTRTGWSPRKTLRDTVQEVVDAQAN